jgi:tetratricopeptide (TPR) repeat protein
MGIKKNRIIGIEAGREERPERGSRFSNNLKRNLFILFSIAAVAASIILLITKFFYTTPDGFSSTASKDTAGIFDSPNSAGGLESANIHIVRGRESYTRGYINDAITEFNEVVDSDASPRDRAIAYAYLGIISDDRQDYKKAVEYFLKGLKFDRDNPAIHRALSRSYRNLKDYKSAAEHAGESVRLKPDDPEALLLLGNIYYDTARYAEAVEKYAEGLKLSPSHPALLYNTGMALLKSGDRFAALEYLKKAASEDKAGTIAHTANSKLGVIYTEMKEYDQAEKYLKQAVAIMPGDPVNRYNLGLAYLKQNRKEEALEQFIKAEEAGSADTSVLENLGDVYASLKDYDRSLNIYEKLLAVNTRNVKILSRIAEIHYEKGDLESALAAFSKITRIEPATENARVAYLNIGNILDDAGRFDEAIESYNKALALNPKDHDAYYNLGIAYRHAEKPELAIQTWKKGADLNPADPKNNLAMADYYYEKGLFDYAEQEYEKIMARWPQMQEVHFKTASIYYKKAKYEFALKGFLRTVEIDGKNDLARRSYINIALIKTRLNDDESTMEESVNMIQRSLMIKPGDSEALYALGTIFFRREMYERAIESFLQAIKGSSDPGITADSYNSMGKCYFKKKEYKRALQSFSRAVEENPSNEEFRMNRKAASEAFESQIRD